MDLVPIAYKELEFGDKIGSGGEGSVFKGKWRLFKNGWEEIQDVAIKRLLTSTDLSELQTLSGLSHPNIINVFGFVKEHHELCIVMELCQYSLRGFFERNPFPLSDENLLRWSLEAALPLEYLRKHNILHRDVKPENYVVDGGMVLKLTDFGVARKLDCTVSDFTHVGTWMWMAPEVHGVKDKRLLLSPSYDIFALGLVLWYLVAREMPYSKSDSDLAIAQATIDGKRPGIPVECPVKLSELIQTCWSGDRKDRPTISQVILLIKDVISSLETTGTLLRIEDMTSGESTGGHLPHLLEASGPSKTQSIPASQVDDDDDDNDDDNYDFIDDYDDDDNYDAYDDDDYAAYEDKNDVHEEDYNYDDDYFEEDNHAYLASFGSSHDSDEDAKPERIMNGEQTKQNILANELPNMCTQPSSSQEKSKKEVDLTLQVSATDKPVSQTQNISEKGNEQNTVLDKERVQEVCLEDGPETKIREQKRRSSVWLCVML